MCLFVFVFSVSGGFVGKTLKQESLDDFDIYFFFSGGWFSGLFPVLLCRAILVILPLMVYGVCCYLVGELLYHSPCSRVLRKLWSIQVVA